MNEFLSVREAARRVGRCTRTVRNWMSLKTGGLRYSRIGDRGRIIIRATWLTEFVERHEVISSDDEGLRKAAESFVDALK